MAPNVKLHFFDAKDINGSVLHEITDEDDYFKKLTLKLERDGLGGAELVLARKVGFAGFGSGTFNPEVFVRIITSAYSDTIYYPWGFFLDKRQQTVVHVDEDGGEEFHFGGPGPKQYLDRSALGIVQETGTGWNLDLENGVWRWNESATVGRVLNRIYQEDQARDDPALPDLTLGFDISDDSNGDPWTDSDLGGPDQFELPIGHSLLDALWDVDDVVELTSWIELGTVATPIFELNVAEGLGLDKTGSAVGAGVCLLKEGLNIANKSLVTEGHSLKKATHVIVEGKDGVWAEAVRPGFSSGDYVKYAKISYTRSNREPWLEKAGIRWLKRQDYGEKELTVEILPGNSDATGYYFPAPNRNLWLSNLISVDTSADGMTHTPLDIQPSEDQLVTGLLLETHTASDTANATAKTRSWDVTVVMNRERPGNVAKTPDQRSAASGGGDCKCLKLCLASIACDELQDSQLTAGTATNGDAENGAGTQWSAGSYSTTHKHGGSRGYGIASTTDGTIVYTFAAGQVFSAGVRYVLDVWKKGSGSHVANHLKFGVAGGDEEESVNDPNLRVETGADGDSWALHRLCWTPAADRTGVRFSYRQQQSSGTFHLDDLALYTTDVADELTGSSGLAARCDHAHRAQAVTYSNGASGLTADNVQTAIDELAAASGGASAPATADYLVGTAQGALSAEIVVGTSPGGELGGTWASPTVDASHSGSTHAATQAAAEATADAALSAHTGDTADAHDASAISFVPVGSIAATDVQAAIAEVAAEAGSSGSPFSVFSTYTPALTATTTNPTLGTGSSVGGRYAQDGKLVKGEAYIQFGTSGVNAGVGNYRISLPINVRTPDGPTSVIGYARLNDNSAGTNRVAVLSFVSATTASLTVVDSGLSTAATVPWTWAANDWIVADFLYEAA